MMQTNCCYVSAVPLFVLCLIHSSTSIPPLLNGVFYELYEDVAYWNVPEWKAEFESLKAINISFVTIGEVFTAYFPNYSIIHSNKTNVSFKHNNINTNDCPFGIFTAFYPSTINCSRPAPNTNTTNMILSVAKELHIKIHLGLALSIQTNRANMSNQEWWTGLYGYSSSVFNELYSLYKDYISDGVLIGIYTVAEISNNKAYVGSQWQNYIYNFTKPLCDLIKSKSNTLLCWASPYYRAPSNTYITASQYANLWNELFINVPNFDFIAIQDSVGGANYTQDNYVYVKDFVSALTNVSNLNNRQMWSNAELFVKWIDESANCQSRRPTNITRYKQQLQVESAFNISALICWEYHSYLSPYSGPCEWNYMAHQLYQNYTTYFHNFTNSKKSV
eukprot:400663_1